MNAGWSVTLEKHKIGVGQPETNNMEDSEKRGVFSKKKKDTFFPPMNIYKGICKPAQLEDIKCRAEFCVTNS